ncbi:MAG: hypothetical protein FJ212_09220, partial [Ignavibacteria bacterium]|nr:hypothetical protein [Ignavibacteria bacterium]
MKIISTYCFLFCITIATLTADTQNIEIQSIGGEHAILMNGKKFFIKGMNWDYFPTGTNYSYSLWNQSETTIKAALDYEMGLLKNMGVNTIRQYIGIPPKWITYIHDKFGIFTVLNHT